MLLQFITNDLQLLCTLAWLVDILLVWVELHSVNREELELNILLLGAVLQNGLVGVLNLGGLKVDRLDWNDRSCWSVGSFGPESVR